MPTRLTTERRIGKGGDYPRRREERDAGAGGARLDFGEVARNALGCAESLVSSWLPNGQRRGREWVSLNPRRADGKPGSFSVNLDSGQWADFATGDRGGDLIALRAFLDGSGQGEALRAVAAELRSPNRGAVAPLPQHHRSSAPSSNFAAAPMVLSPPTIVPNFRHPRLGDPCAKWGYSDTSGHVVGYACRFDLGEGGKEVVPLSWDGAAWRWKAMPEPRKLYRLPDLLARPNAVVVIVEGEKTAEATAAILPDAVATTWAGGCKAWQKSDWFPLKGRQVIAVPDNDEPGVEAMEEIARALLALSVASVKLVELPPGLPVGWDLADGQAEGWKRADVVRLLAGKFPAGLCPRCWVRNIAAPLNGPTCRHTIGWKWPVASTNHEHGDEENG